MNNLETNALRIAELMGYKLTQEITYTPTYVSDGLKFTGYEIEQIFSSYNGLMPIVFECNKSKDFYYTRIHINPQDYDTISIWSYCDSQELADLVAKFDYDRESEPEFIEAIQLACIKYLELKDE